jgi:hypothetical protein
VLVPLMGSSILSEVDDTSILRTGLSIRYWRPLDRLPASRLLPPRSGLERSDFVLWPIASVRCDAAIRPELGANRKAFARSSLAGFDSKRERKWTSRRNKRAKAPYILPPPGREIVAPGISSAFPHTALAKPKLMLRIHERR